MEVLRAQGVEAVDLSLADLPMFNGDLDGPNRPDAVVVFREILASADGVLISAPEFNHSIPAVLKNAIEWASRPPGALTDKVVLPMGATPGRSGGIRMRAHLVDCLDGEGSWIIPRPVVLVPNVESAIGPDGGILDPALGELLEQSMSKLVETVNKMAAR
jgi:chromate reductase